MKENTTLSLWLKPEGSTFESLAAIIKDLAQKHDSPMFEPHVTLLPGLNAPADSILHKLEKIAETASPVEIQLGRIGYKDNLYQSFFAHVVNQDVYQLRRQCEEALGNPMMEGYMPHLSLMYYETPEKEKETLSEGLGGSVDVKFMASNIHVVSTAGNPSEWKEITVIPLQGHG